MSSNNNLIAVLTHGGPFDRHMIQVMKSYLLETSKRMREAGQPVTQSSLARELKTNRNRVARMVNHLGITHIFDVRKRLHRGV
jgi:CRP-like cAMP-binding protein